MITLVYFDTLFKKLAFCTVVICNFSKNHNALGIGKKKKTIAEYEEHKIKEEKWGKDVFALAKN